MSEGEKHIAVLKEMLAWMNMSSEIIEKDDPFFRVHEHRKKAVKYAISSLETDEAYNLMYEEFEFCEDCISRKNILESLNGVFPSTDWNKALFRKIVMDSPCVLPKAKKGHWKAFIHNAYHGTDEDGEPIWREVTVYHCSHCNRRTVIKEKFCPNCGCRMVEPQESEDKERQIIRNT